MRLLSRLVIAATLVASLIAARPASSSPARTAFPQRYAVVIVLDGASPSYFRLAKMPNLQRLMRNGVSYSRAFVGQLIANTPPSHATIGTGMYPRDHGIEGFLWEDPRTGLMTRPTDLDRVDKGQLTAVMQARHVPSIAGRLKQADPKARIVSVSGHKCYASDAMGTAAADYILCAKIYHNRWVAQAVGGHYPPPGAINNPKWDVQIPPRTNGTIGAAVQQWPAGNENDWTTRYALWAFHRVHYPRLLMINLPETDVLGHFERTMGPVRMLMQHFDRLLGQIMSAYRKAGLLSRTDFVITADHAMSRIHATLPNNLITNAVDSTGTSSTYVETDTAASIGLVDDSKARAVALNIERSGGRLVDATFYKVHQNGQWTYRLAASRPDSPGDLLNAYETLVNTSAADAGPDVLALYAPNVSSRSFITYGYPWAAGHLGPQWQDQHIPLIIAGPGVRHNVVSNYPARLIDIAPTVERLLHLNHNGVSGSVLEDALTYPDAAKKNAQARRGAQLAKIVQALQVRGRHL